MTPEIAINFRAATLSDQKILFDWRNDQQTRLQSLNQDFVTWESHQDWFDKSLKTETRQIFIAVDQGRSVGMIRWDQKNKARELSWLIGSEFRGHGYGNKMLKQFIQMFPFQYEAKVRVSNQASLKMALNAGFRLRLEKDDIYYLTLAGPL